jgi:hypothetical protein
MRPLVAIIDDFVCKADNATSHRDDIPTLPKAL